MVRLAVLVLCGLCIAAVCTPEVMRQEVFGEEQLRAQAPTDFVLVIDKSGSMRVGNRFAEAQQAATLFVDQLSGGDRAAIVAFDSRAEVLSEFSANKQHLTRAIQQMTIGDWTQYQQGLAAARQLFTTRRSGANHNPVIVFMSDGYPDDTIDDLLARVQEITQEGVCIYTIAYAEEALDEAQDILAQIADISQQNTGCGAFFSAQEDTFELERSYQIIYAEVSSEQVLSVDVDFEMIDNVRMLFRVASARTQEELSSCFAPEKRVVITQNGRVVHDTTLTQNTHVIPDIFPGEYEYFVFARETCEGTCLLTGVAQGTFLVDASVVACTPTWNELSTLLSAMGRTEVLITPEGFRPQTISTQGVVVWRNADTQPRQVVSTTGAFESPVLAPGDEWEFIFPAGSHGYREAAGGFSGALRNQQQPTTTPVDVVLVIDNSGSMAGSAMENAREAAINFVGVLGPQDRIGLVVFDHRATIAQHLTSDTTRVRNAINAIVPQGGTLYIPALQAVGEVLRFSPSQRERIVIFLSDGIPHDLGGLPDILRTIDEEIGEACLFTIGYAEEGVEAIETLNQMGEHAQQRSGCGSFFYAPNDKEALGRVLGEVYAQTQEPRLQIHELTITEEEQGVFVVQTRVRSKENGMLIPSETNLGCVPPAFVRALVGPQEFPLRYNGEYYAGRIQLEPGAHVGYVTASVSAFDTTVHSAFGFERVELVVRGRNPWYLWVMLIGGLAGILYLFMHRPTRY